MIGLQKRDVYTVGRLNREARRLLETGLSMLWVEGEISNLAMPASGHWYFTLKDANAQVRCAMFRGRNRLLKVRPQNGMHVVVRGRVSLYEPRGDYQLIAENLREAGEGALQAAYERLRAKLSEEGLFDQEHKQPLPALPARVGVITSPTGAVIRDIRQVLARRFPGLPIRVYPVPVQGEAAAPAIVAALRLAAQRRDCDVLIVARGGGSLEDLWAFNEESVARAVFASPIPIVSAVGHETDVTICDFVADVRAPTPSAAAELVAPDAADLAAGIAALASRMQRALRGRLERAGSELRYLGGRHRQNHPGRIVEQMTQRVDQLDRRLHSALTIALATQRRRVAQLETRLRLNAPSRQLARLRARTDTAGQRLRGAASTLLARHRTRLSVASRALETIGPQATLDRGYAIVSRADDDRIVVDPATLAPGDALRLRLARGTTRATVDDEPGTS